MQAIVDDELADVSADELSDLDAGLDGQGTRSDASPDNRTSDEEPRQ